jgi:hypothetical protein
LTTSPTEAHRTVQHDLGGERPQGFSKELREDDSDYFAVLEIHGEWPCGGIWTFVSKATGQLWHGVPTEHFDKSEGMRAVTSSGPGSPGGARSRPRQTGR